jgi:hypothetical protein
MLNRLFTRTTFVQLLGGLRDVSEAGAYKVGKVRVVVARSGNLPVRANNFIHRFSS